MRVEVRTVSAAPLATELEDLRDYAEVSPIGLAPSSEQARYQPRFRVVKRRPLVSRRRVRVSPLSRAMIIGAFPALLLLAYVVGRIAVIGCGYTKDALRAELARLEIERVELQAEKSGLQEPGRIGELAAKRLGMQPAVERRFVQLPASASKAP
jgi:cell division protein FtsL